MTTGEKRKGKISLAIWGIVGVFLAADFWPFVSQSETQKAVETVWLADSEEQGCATELFGGKNNCPDL